MTTLPVHDVTRPAVLAGQANGKLPTSILASTPGQASGPLVWLVAPATRGWRALCAAARGAGHVLKATSLYDSYRPYAVQESLFRARYTTAHISGASTKVWQGSTWYLRPGNAMAAVPGTSNHGLGLAVDIGDELDGDAGTEAIDTATVAWLVAHAATYGFSAELQSEPWHWRWFPGDIIPPAVLAFEQHGEDDDMELGQEWDGSFLIKRVESLVRMNPTYTVTLPDKSTRTETNALVQAVLTLETKVSTPAPVEVDAVTLAAAFKLALQDPATLTALAKAVNDDLHARTEK